MGDVLLLVAGATFLLVILFDIARTVVSLHGAGPVTSRFGSSVWALVRALYGRRRRSWLLAYGGPAIALLTVWGWIVGEWLAWGLIFSAGDPGVVDAETGEPADAWGRFYFAGYALFTLGLGELRPEGPFWQIMTDLAAANGFLTISMSAAYLLPVLSAAARTRQVAIHINGLGPTPWDIVIASWNGRDFSNLGQHLVSLTPTIIEVGQNHLAYPVLHYYQSPRREASLAVQLVSLDEALHILACGVRPDIRLPAVEAGPAREGILSVLASLRRGHIRPTGCPPPPLSLEPLRRAGIPVVDDAEFAAAMDQVADRRRLSLALLRDACWDWSEVARRKLEIGNGRP